MGMMKEFKEFAIKGNLIDMAIGVVMGGAFGRVVSSFIDGMVIKLCSKKVCQRVQIVHWYLKSL